MRHVKILIGKTEGMRTVLGGVGCRDNIKEGVK
jgi:hypothetical protein